jgi:hypothetical protein
MALFLYVVIPAGWALTGWLLGRAVSRSVATEAGRRVARRLGRWCSWLLPGVYCALLLLGVSGNAGGGFRLFGSEELFALLCLPFYTVPTLVLYLILAQVIHDLLRGLRGWGWWSR